MRAFKVKIYGDIKKSNKEIAEYELEGIIPYCDEEEAQSVCINRYAPLWLKKKGISYINLITCYLDEDEMEEIDYDFSLIGKDIKEMTAEELQDLAVIKKLRGIRLYNQYSLRESRLRAYQEYLFNYKNDVKSFKDLNEWRKARREVDVLEVKDLKKLPPIIITDDTKKTIRVENTQEPNEKKGNFNIEEKSDEKRDYSLEDLKSIADENGILYHSNIGFNKLKSRLIDEDLI